MVLCFAGVSDVIIHFALARKRNLSDATVPLESNKIFTDFTIATKRILGIFVDNVKTCIDSYAVFVCDIYFVFYFPHGPWTIGDEF